MSTTLVFTIDSVLPSTFMTTKLLSVYMKSKITAPNLTGLTQTMFGDLLCTQ